MIDLTHKRILITGAEGFLGRHVVKELSLRGCRHITQSDSSIDLRIQERAQWLIKSTTPQIVIHCAGRSGGIGACKTRPAEFFYDNAIMGINLMDAAYRGRMGRKHEVEKFVQIGSVCEYPKHTCAPFLERDLWDGYPEETNAPYGLAKKALLTMGQAYRKQYGFNVIHLLLVNMYGPHDNFDPWSSHVIPSLIRKMDDAKTHDQTVSLWGTGNAFREFLYVEDAARAIVLATESYNGHDPVNIGTGAFITIRNLAQAIAEKLGYTNFNPVWDETMPDGQLKRRLDVSRAREEFDFEAKVELSEGLDKTIEWYKREKKNV